MRRVVTGQLFHHGLGVVGLAHAHAAAGDDGIGLLCGVAEGGFQQFRLVGYHAQVNHVAAQALQQAEHGVAVAVVHSTFAWGLPQAQDFVTGGKVRDLQRAKHLDRGQAQAGHQSQRCGCEALAFVQGRSALHQVFTGKPAVVAALQRVGRNADGGCRRHGLGHLLRHYGVQPGGHDGPGHDLHALAGPHAALPGFAGKRGAAHGLQHQRLAGVQGCTVERVAIHGRVVMRWHADGRHDVRCQHAVVCGHQWQGFGFAHGLYQFGQKGVHAVGAEGLRVVALQLGCNVINVLHVCRLIGMGFKLFNLKFSPCTLQFAGRPPAVLPTVIRGLPAPAIRPGCWR